jgi:DNA (cytosine-5)-methyltransferase 1
VRWGSLFTGIGGLDLAVEMAGLGEVVWMVEQDPNCRSVLRRHYPGVPLYDDVSTLPWASLPPVDGLVGGFPCQDVSTAGARRGLGDDTRTGLWRFYRRAIRVLRPRLAFVENVAGLVSLGLDTVLADLAEIGFDAEWTTVRAADVGACHRRERLFLVAYPAGTGDREITRSTCRDEADDARRKPPDRDLAGGDGTPGRADGRVVKGDTPAYPDEPGGEARRDPGRDGQRLRLQPVGLAESPADAPDDRQQWGGIARRRGGRPEDGGAVVWGGLEPAIRRWELVFGRAAPPPTDERGRLNPVFVEWMMGFPQGWVGGLTRTAALKALGNAVVPQQGAYALSVLLESVP